MNFVPTQDTAVTISARPLPDFTALEGLWRDLEGRADGSFFTSWTWIGSWLGSFSEDGRPPNVNLVTAHAGHVVVGLALVGQSNLPSVFGSRTIAALHQTGLPYDDVLFIEYNDFLMDRRYAAPVREALLAFIAARNDKWREFRLSGVTPDMLAAVTQAGLPHAIARDHHCPWIDLAGLPSGVDGYLSVLSKNTRQQVQRSLRLYEDEGEVRLSQAASVAEAGIFLAELADQHKRSWHARKGHGGAFISNCFARFTAKLIDAGNVNGSIQLLRASAGGQAFGYLLNFVHRGHVYAYQSGFSYRGDNRYRPGLVTHALAAAHAREQGLLGYHFMAGDGRYKSSLANADEQLLWITLRHDDLMSRAEDGARALKSGVKALLRNVTG